MVYMYHSFLIHSSADGHLGCFHVLAMINSAATASGSFPVSQFFTLGGQSVGVSASALALPVNTQG